MSTEIVELIVIRNEDTGTIFGIYDISKMSGTFKDYHDGEFNNYDEYEDDMISRGAVRYQYVFHEI